MEKKYENVFSIVLEQCVGNKLRKATRSSSRFFDIIFAELGFKTTQIILMLHVGAEGIASVPSLSRALVMEQSTVSKNLKPLIKVGHIKKCEKNPKGRIISYSLTPEGFDVLERALPIWQSAHSKLIDKIGENVLDDLMSALDATVNITRLD